MLLPKIKGLKFPDEFVVRTFFKSGLFELQGNAIEFGSQNGNNLSLFYQYGWSVTGIDIVESSILMARENFSVLAKESNALGSYQFLAMDMLEYQVDRTWDAILFPSSLYYVSHESCLRMLSKLPSMLSEKGAFCYFRMRRPDDYRVGISRLLEDGLTRLVLGDETDEKGCQMTFCEPDDFIAEIRKHCKFENPIVLRSQFDNLQNGKITKNSDFILWGRLAK